MNPSKSKIMKAFLDGVKNNFEDDHKRNPYSYKTDPLLWQAWEVGYLGLKNEVIVTMIRILKEAEK